MIERLKQFAALVIGGLGIIAIAFFRGKESGESSATRKILERDKDNAKEIRDAAARARNASVDPAEFLRGQGRLRD